MISLNCHWLSLDGNNELNRLNLEFLELGRQYLSSKQKDRSANEEYFKPIWNLSYPFQRDAFR